MSEKQDETIPPGNSEDELSSLLRDVCPGCGSRDVRRLSQPHKGVCMECDCGENWRPDDQSEPVPSVTPQAATPSGGEQLYRIKPIAWEEIDGGDSAMAHTPFGVVTASRLGASCFGRIWIDNDSGATVSIEQSKAAAERAYREEVERLLMPCLSPPPSSPAPATDGLDKATMEADRAQLQGALGGGPRMSWGECIALVESMTESVKEQATSSPAPAGEIRFMSFEEMWAQTVAHAEREGIDLAELVTKASKHFEKPLAPAGEGAKKDDRWYPVECYACGFKGSFKEFEEERADYDEDMICPMCYSSIAGPARSPQSPPLSPATATTDLAAWQQFAGYCRSCALSGESNPDTFEQFVARKNANKERA